MSHGTDGLPTQEEPKFVELIATGTTSKGDVVTFRMQMPERWVYDYWAKQQQEQPPKPLAVPWYRRIFRW